MMNWKPHQCLRWRVPFNEVKCFLNTQNWSYVFINCNLVKIEFNYEVTILASRRWSRFFFSMWENILQSPDLHDKREIFAPFQKFSNKTRLHHFGIFKEPTKKYWLLKSFKGSLHTVYRKIEQVHHMRYVCTRRLERWDLRSDLPASVAVHNGVNFFLKLNVLDFH